MSTNFVDLLQPLKVLDKNGLDISNVDVAMNLKLDACVVPTSNGQDFRIDEAHLVVLDNFVDETMRQDILDYVTEKGWDHSVGPPESKWEKRTTDSVGMPATWGLKAEQLAELVNSDCEALLEVQTRLCALYPEVDIYHMPSHLLHPSKPEVEDAEEEVFCDQFVCNAAVSGDQFNWHVDADPSNLTECPWVHEYGLYSNREAGKPLFVSMLMYLNDEWDRRWNAETLFLDTGTDTGVFVRPKAGRIVLMDQDIVHRLSSPSADAPVPRYSIVWKLIFMNKNSNEAEELCIARPEWGRSTAFGSSKDQHYSFPSQQRSLTYYMELIFNIQPLN
eukprot:TRINITY_DN76_c4_g1_i3.p1 TRINITY_DN76_c4_g1~~TRINITY_DN76_c4_g1_i3.p1  ORF type:complete len:333 (+),score=27.30 TRINITY_DN76_c4_g1_i3:228-1226(+)